MKGCAGEYPCQWADGTGGMKHTLKTEGVLLTLTVRKMVVERTVSTAILQARTGHAKVLDAMQTLHADECVNDE